VKGLNSDGNNATNKLSAAEKELLDLTGNINLEELTMVQQDDANNGEDGTDEDEDNDG